MNTKMKMNRWGWSSLAMAAAVWCGPALHAQEVEGEGQEPQAPAEEEQKKPDVTPERLSAVIKGYVESRSQEGSFKITDSKNHEEVTLALVRIQKDKLYRIGDSTFLARCDFNREDGTPYELDFIATAGENGIEVTEVLIYKVNGEPRYTWYEEDGVWKRRPVGEKEEGSAGEGTSEEAPEEGAHRN